MNLKQIEYFIQVAEQGSFSKAALVQRVAQPALSRQVRALETELRETLLLRNGRGVTLTVAGKRLLQHCHGILQLVANARHDLDGRRDEPAGHIVVGLPPSLARQLTQPLVDAFRAGLPKARLSIVEGFSAHLGEWLSSGRVDVGLVYNPEPLSALEFAPVMTEPLCLIGPPGRKQRKTVPFRDLPRYPLVLPQRGHIFRRLMEVNATLSGVRLDVAWEVSSVPAILDLVRGGYGYAALTDSALRSDDAPDGLTVARIREPEIKITLCLATSARKRPTPLSRQVVQILADLANTLSGGKNVRAIRRGKARRAASARHAGTLVFP